MDMKKFKQKFKEKLPLRGPRVNLNESDQGGQSDFRHRHGQQLANDRNTAAGVTAEIESLEDVSRTSTSTPPLTGTRSQPRPLCLPSGSRRESQPKPKTSDTPIHELWNLAYENLRETDEELIVKYEAKLRRSFTAGLSSTLGLTLGSRADRRDQMSTILQRKMDEINRETWKLKFGSTEVQVKDLVKPVLGVVNWANEFIKTAMSADPSASIAWAGVSLLLPILLNPSKQAASLAKGLEYISSLIVQGRMWERLYIRRCETNDSQTGKPSPSSIERIAFKESLEMLYQEILRFQVESYCYYDTNAALRLGQDIIKWNGWDDTLERIREQESRFASINAIWMDITYAEEHSAADKRHLEAMRCWQTVGTDTSSLLEVVRCSQAEKKREGLLDWLCTVDPSEAYNAARDKHMRGTSVWLVENSKEFQDWKRSAGSVLWLNGKPGSGKSILSSSVIKHLREQYASDPRIALAYFFFSFTDQQKQKVDGMLASLLKQIFARRPDTPEPIRSLSEYKARGERPDTETLEAALLATTHGFSATFIVIDALDECPTFDGERGKLLTSLSRIIAAMPDHLHILCTSRAESDVIAAMSTVISPPSRAEIDLMIYRDSLNRDIGLYIDETLASAAYSTWPTDLKEEAKELLIENADGMFQYIYCQFESLQNLASVSLVRRELHRLPVGLDATYERLLLGLSERFRNQILNALKWLTSSNRSMTLVELAEIFVLLPESDVVFDETYRLFQPEDIIKYMSSLVVVQSVADHQNSFGSGSAYVRLAHFTIKEYLMSDRLAESSANYFYFTDTDAHLHIAHSCLAYYLHCIARLDQDIRNLELRGYAFESWMLHLEMVPRELWSDKVSSLAARALAMRSMSLHTILEADEATLTELTGVDTTLSLRIEMSKPHLYTALKGFTHLTDMLISGGPGTNPYLTQEDIDLALHHAALGGCNDTVRLLLNKGADCNASNGRMGNALEAAACQRLCYKLMSSALRVAISRGHLNAVQLLVSRGSDIDASILTACAKASIEVAGKIRDDWNVKCLSFLLDSGSDVNGQHPTDGTALHCAAARMSMQCIRLLLERGADVNLPGGDYGFPLQAMCYGRADISGIRLLLDSGADINADGGKYGTALQALFANRSLESHHKKQIAELLVEKGANINLHGGFYGSTLQAACTTHGKPRTEEAEYLLENGAEIGVEGGYYGNALQAACYCNRSHTAQLLLDMGLSVNALGGEFGSPLQAAAADSSHESRLVELLLSRGADVNALGGRYGTALQAACECGDVSSVRRLLDHGAEVNVENGMYGTALQAACSSRKWYSEEIARLLIEHGADLHRQGGKFGSGWHAAASRGWNLAFRSNTMIQFLLSRGVDIDDTRGLLYATALHAALEIPSPRESPWWTPEWSRKSRIDRVGFLLDHGANVNVGGGKYGFPLQAACAVEHEYGEELTEFLLKRCPGIHLNATGGLFGSALQAAAYSGQINSVRMLLDKGAHVNANGGLCRSALNAAIFAGYWDTVQVLLDSGAVPDSQPDEEWLEDIRNRLGRGAVERYWKFWEKTGSMWSAFHADSEG